MPLPFIMAAAAPAVTSLWTILFGSIGISAVTTLTILVGGEYLLLSQKEKTPEPKLHTEVVSALNRAQSAGTKVVAAAATVETTAQSVSKSSTSLGVATSTAKAASTQLVATLPVLTDTSVRVADVAQTLAPVLVEHTRASGVTASSLAGNTDDIVALKGTVVEQAAIIVVLREDVSRLTIVNNEQRSDISRLSNQVTFFRQAAQQSMVPKEASNQNQGGLSYAS